MSSAFTTFFGSASRGRRGRRNEHGRGAARERLLHDGLVTVVAPVDRRAVDGEGVGQVLRHGDHLARPAGGGDAVHRPQRLTRPVERAARDDEARGAAADLAHEHRWAGRARRLRPPRRRRPSRPTPRRRRYLTRRQSLPRRSNPAVPPEPLEPAVPLAPGLAPALHAQARLPIRTAPIPELLVSHRSIV